MVVAFYALVLIWTPQHSFAYSCAQNGLSHREVGLCLGKFAWNRNQRLQLHRRIQGQKLQGIIMRREGQCLELRDMPTALGWKHPAWDLLRLGYLSCACRKLCTWVSVHIGISCARGCLCTWVQQAPSTHPRSQV